MAPPLGKILDPPLLSHYQWWIQDFPDGGGGTSDFGAQNLSFSKIFAENCRKKKEIGPGGASLAPRLDPPMTMNDYVELKKIWLLGPPLQKDLGQNFEGILRKWLMCQKSKEIIVKEIGGSSTAAIYLQTKIKPRWRRAVVKITRSFIVYDCFNKKNNFCLCLSVCVFGVFMCVDVSTCPFCLWCLVQTCQGRGEIGNLNVQHVCVCVCVEGGGGERNHAYSGPVTVKINHNNTIRSKV